MHQHERTCRQRNRDADEATHADEGRVAGGPPHGSRDCRHAGEDIGDGAQLAAGCIPLLLDRKRWRSGSRKVPVRGGVGVHVVAACRSTGKIRRGGNQVGIDGALIC